MGSLTSKTLGPGSVLVVSTSTRESLREEASLQSRFKRGYRVIVKNCLWQQDHGYGASASHGVPVYTPVFTGVKLYCLVTEALGCEQLAQGRYSMGLKLVTTESQVRCSSH